MRYAALIEKTFTVKSRSGPEFLCICPWHDDKSGHLYVNAEKGVYFCQSCGEKGSLISKKDGRAVKLPPAGLDDVRKKIRTMRQGRPQQEYKPESWLRQFDVAHPYWSETRGLPPEIIARFGLGYDAFSNRVTLPLRDVRGRILGVTYRRLDDGSPRYLHPKAFPTGRHLYGGWLLGHHRTVGLTEGQVDAIAGHVARVPAASTMGARVTADQVRVLQRMGVRKVVMLYDNDNAGRKGILRAYDMFRGSGIIFTAGWYRPYWTVYDPKIDAMRPVKDPDELTPERYRKFYHSAVSIYEWAQRSGALESSAASL